MLLVFPFFWRRCHLPLQKRNLQRAVPRFYKECSKCHEVGDDAKNKVGPHLDRIIGRKAGSVEAFRYSNALKKAGEDGLHWDETSLDQYIEKPRDFIKGNRMSYRGMASADDRKALVGLARNHLQSEPSGNLDDQRSGFHRACTGLCR